jgi:cell division protein FtsZ
MVFICAGLGGGTGSGAAPIVAEVAKELGALVFVFATTPFSFEGRRRLMQAEVALEALQPCADALILFENNRMGELVLPKEGIQKAFSQADQLIGYSVRAIATMVNQPGIVRVSLADLTTALRTPNSRCLFGFGEGRGTNRVTDALKRALKSPLVNQGLLLQNAQNLIVHIAGGDSITLAEVDQLMKQLGKHVPEETQIMFGVTVDPKLADLLTVTLVSSLDACDMALEPATRAAASERISARPSEPARPLAKPGPAPAEPAKPAAVHLAVSSNGRHVAAKTPKAQPQPQPQPQPELLPAMESPSPATAKSNAEVTEELFASPPAEAEIAQTVTMEMPVPTPAQQSSLDMWFSPAVESDPAPPVIPKDPEVECEPVMEEKVAEFEAAAPEPEPEPELEPIAPVAVSPPPTPAQTPAPIAAPTEIPRAEAPPIPAALQAPTPPPVRPASATPVSVPIAPKPIPVSSKPTTIKASIFSVIDDDDEEVQEEESGTTWADKYIQPKPQQSAPQIERREPARQPEPALAGAATTVVKATGAAQKQPSLNLHQDDVGRFKGTDKTIVEGEDLDVPTWMRLRGKIGK